MSDVYRMNSIRIKKNLMVSEEKGCEHVVWCFRGIFVCIEIMISCRKCRIKIALVIKQDGWVEHIFGGENITGRKRVARECDWKPSRKGYGAE